MRFNISTDHTALHEAGHAVAHERLDIHQGSVSIEPDAETLGRCKAEGAKHVYSADEAQKQVMAFLAGYAALIAAGCNEEDASAGADDDFEQAADLFESWDLGGDLVSWKAEAVDFMSTGENVKAVRRLADELLSRITIGDELTAVIVDVADGEITEAELEQYILMSRQTETRQAQVRG